MKPLLTLVIMASSLFSLAQKKYSAKDLFTSQEIVWYGIDYSKARFIGSFAQFKDAGEVDERTLVNSYFPGWNLVIIREPAKYNIARFFKKDFANNDLTAVTKINRETKPDGIMQENDYTLDATLLPAMIKKYSGGERKEGLGVVFIAEGYNHTRERGSYYVVVFDIASKQILISEKYAVEPGGFGVKSYWISTALKTLEAISRDYDNWKRKYGR